MMWQKSEWKNDWKNPPKTIMGGEKFVGNLEVTIFMFMCLCLFVWYPVINVYMFENLYHHNSGESLQGFIDLKVDLLT